MNNNFKCNTCGHEHFVYHFRRYSNPVHYVDKAGNTCTCPECKSTDLCQIGEIMSRVEINSFNSLSNADKKTMLKKRSDDHFKKHIAEKKQHINEQFGK